MDVSFQIDELFGAFVSPDAIELALQTTIDLFGQDLGPDSGLTIIVTDDGTLRELNRQYRGIDAATDVLSFTNNPDPDFPEVDPEISNHLGDIVIAYPLASAQAAARGHRTSDEITLLAVHGALHLLGFDHQTVGAKDKMWAAQDQVMARLDLSHIKPTEH